MRYGDSITDFDAFKSSDGTTHNRAYDEGTNFAAFK